MPGEGIERDHSSFSALAPRGWSWRRAPLPDTVIVAAPLKQPSHPTFQSVLSGWPRECQRTAPPTSGSLATGASSPFQPRQEDGEGAVKAQWPGLPQGSSWADAEQSLLSHLARRRACLPGRGLQRKDAHGARKPLRAEAKPQNEVVSEGGQQGLGWPRPCHMPHSPHSHLPPAAALASARMRARWETLMASSEPGHRGVA